MSDVNTKIEAIDEKIEALLNERGELLRKQALIHALYSLAEGTVVSFNAGRGETRRTVVGTVLSTYTDAKDNRKAKVLAGEGAGVELFDINVNTIIAVQSEYKVTE